MLLWRYAADVIKVYNQCSLRKILLAIWMGMIQSVKRFKSRTEASHKKLCHGLQFQLVPEFQPVLPDGLPSGLQTCLASLHNHISQCLAINPWICISNRFCFSGWTLDPGYPWRNKWVIRFMLPLLNSIVMFL